jgi:hypothetical protein
VSTIKHETHQKTIQDILNLYEDKHLNLEPGFQRSSVWADRDRAKLIDSILRGYPLHSITVPMRSVPPRAVKKKKYHQGDLFIFG